MRIISSPIRDGVEAAREEDPKREQYKTKAAVVEFVKKAFADGAAAIKKKGDKGLNDLVVDPFANQQTRVSDMAWGLLEHSANTMGNWWCITALPDWRRRSLVPRSSGEPGVPAQPPKLLQGRDAGR